MSAPSTVLVTGGAGFIGSHACADLLDHGYELIVVDDYSNSTPQVFTRVQRVAGRFVGAVYELDVRDRQALSAVFHRHAVDAVVHFAALKSVSRSVRMPVEYYDTNIAGTTALLRTMQEHGVHRLIFASTCSIYGDASRGPLDESAPARPTNPFAASKWVCEQILADVCARRPEYAVMSLRYFNPVGAHPSGLLGEAPHTPPGKLMPTLAQVASGQQDRLRVYGNDYPTPDGTAVRDYVHVMDTVEALRVALDHLGDESGMRVYNLGRGEGRSVLDVVTQFSRTTGRPIPHEVVPRRLGDVAEFVADAGAAARDLCWRPTRDLDAMCRDAWRFQRLHPHGYADSPRRPKSKEY